MSGKTVTRADLYQAIYQKVGRSRTQSATFVELVLKEITDCLERGETVKLSSFGLFVVRQKGQRLGRNPRTGEEVPISPVALSCSSRPRSLSSGSMRLVRHFDESPGQIYVAVDELEPPPRLFIAPQNLIFLPPPPEQDSDFRRARPQDLILVRPYPHIAQWSATSSIGARIQRRPRSSRPYPVADANEV